MKLVGHFAKKIFRNSLNEFLVIIVALWLMLVVIDPVISSMIANTYGTAGYLWFGAMLVAVFMARDRAVNGLTKPKDRWLRIGLSLVLGSFIAWLIKEPSWLKWSAAALTALVTWGILDSVNSDEREYVE